MLPPVPAQWCLRGSIALVWLYQGLWHKIIDPGGQHQRLLAAAFGTPWSRPFGLALGALETAIALAVLADWWPDRLSWLQIGLLAVMNTGGLVVAGREIPDPVGMLTLNAAFACAIWLNGWLAVHRAQQ
jgi:hypothetical protein